jgi:hypothetical protein
MAAMSGLGHAIGHFIESRPATPGLFGYLAAAAVLAALLHELGHALVAVTRADAPVQMSFGGTRHLLRVRLRRLKLTAGLLADPAPAAGSDSREAARAAARELILLALGGPIASLCGFAAAACGLAAVAGHGFLHNCLWAITVTCFVAALGAVPLEIGERRGGARLRTDGRIVLDALRAQRSLSEPAAAVPPSWLTH